MNTPSELFDFYETYLNIYEEADKKKPKPTVLPRSRETDIGDQTQKGWNDPAGPERDWDREPTNRPTNRAAQASRLRKIVGTQRRQDIESGVRKEDVEYVLDYLIDEGFTDSYEGAEAILETMSDEWLEGIIDERTRYAKETGRSATQRAVYQGRENRSLKGGYLAPEVNKTPEDEKHNRLMVAVRKYGFSIPKVKQTKKERGGPTPTPPYHLTPKEKVAGKREKPPVDYYSSRND
jgi:hypothetical protein